MPGMPGIFLWGRTIGRVKSENAVLHGQFSFVKPKLHKTGVLCNLGLCQSLPLL
jgi:hypothetical protein